MTQWKRAIIARHKHWRGFDTVSPCITLSDQDAGGCLTWPESYLSKWECELWLSCRILTGPRGPLGPWATREPYSVPSSIHTGPLCAPKAKRTLQQQIAVKSQRGWVQCCSLKEYQWAGRQVYPSWQIQPGRLLCRSYAEVGQGCKLSQCSSSCGFVQFWLSVCASMKSRWGSQKVGVELLIHSPFDAFWFSPEFKCRLRDSFRFSGSRRRVLCSVEETSLINCPFVLTFLAFVQTTPFGPLEL